MRYLSKFALILFYITLPTGNSSLTCTHDLHPWPFHSFTFLSRPQHIKHRFDFIFAFLKFEQHLLAQYASLWFWSSDMSLTLISHVTKFTHFLRFSNCRYVGHLVNSFVNSCKYSRYTRPCLPSFEAIIFLLNSPRGPRKHPKQCFDFSVFFIFLPKLPSLDVFHR